MTTNLHIKQIHDLKYYTGAHPEIRSLLKRNQRPTEFGNKVWETSLVLLNYLQTKPIDFNELRVLEIGCGWGLLGVYMAKQFSCKVTCSDLDSRVFPIVKLHADLNKVDVQTQCASFNDLSVDSLKDFDLIIGAEVCYSDEVSVDICQLIKNAFDAGVGNILIGDPGRPGFDDCIKFCTETYKTKIIELPGTANGKTTHLLRAYE